MIDIKNAEYLERIKIAQKNVGIYKDYINDVLKPAIEHGDWDELEQLDIGFDDNGKSLGKISLDKWELSRALMPNGSTKNLLFTNCDVQFERNLKNQLKALMLKMLWISPKPYSLNACSAALTSLKKVAVALLDDGENSFASLTFERLEEWALSDETNIDFRYRPTYDSLNKLVTEKFGLPFTVHFPKLAASDFALTLNEAEQHNVIPERIYLNALLASEREVNSWYARRKEIEDFAQYILDFKASIWHSYAEHIHKKGSPSYLSKSKICEAFRAAFHALENPTLDEIYDLVLKIRPPIRHGDQKVTHLPHFKYTFDNVEYRTFNDAITKLNELTGCFGWLAIAKSGMRLDEFYNLHTTNGCSEQDIAGQTIFTFNADIDKTVKGSQKKQDTFVTTQLGKKAFELLNCIHKPFRAGKEGAEHAFFYSPYTQTKASKTSLHGYITKWFDDAMGNELILTEEDMKALHISDPEQTKQILGETYQFSCHQLRRSFAYYLIGYELLSFPQLKQQFSHVSLAMSRHYAKNASKFQKWKKSTYSEVQDERIKQKAAIYLRIYEKFANNERVAGGKGAEFAKRKARMKQGAFKDRRDNDMLSLAYWESKLRRGKTHIHAVAPGIYCTSTNCSLRTQVNLLECVDCDNDYIVDAVFAEAKRKEAEEHMLFDIEHNELTPQTASEAYIKVQAAERIMNDLGLDYEPVNFPKEVSDMLIPYGVVAS